MLPAEVLDLLWQWWKARPIAYDTGLALGKPFLGGGGLALRAVPIAAAVVGNDGIGESSQSYRRILVTA